MQEVYAALYNENLEEIYPPQVSTLEDILSWNLEIVILLKGE
jgi:hypothetical protein